MNKEILHNCFLQILSIYLLALTSLQAQTTLQAPGGGTNYQWYQDTGTGTSAIAGATSDSYNTMDIGTYYATYDGSSCGNNASDYFILVDPCEADVTLNAPTIAGATYQWYDELGSMAGETNANLSVIASTTLGSYYLEVTNVSACKSLFPTFNIITDGTCTPLCSPNIFTQVIKRKGAQTICDILIGNPSHPLATQDCDGGGMDNLTECQNGGNPEDPNDD